MMYIQWIACNGDRIIEKTTAHDVVAGHSILSLYTSCFPDSKEGCSLQEIGILKARYVFDKIFLDVVDLVSSINLTVC